jgi:hypothetical protein
LRYDSRVRVVPFVVSACVCAGCDGVWDLEHIEPITPASCAAPIGHDEDLDGVDDACDPCPFDIRNAGDDDLDGIAVACDPDPATPNQLVLFTGFDEVSRSSLTLTGGGYVDDAYHVSGIGSVQLIAKIDPTAVWVRAGVAVHRREGTGYAEIGFVFDSSVVSMNTQLNGFLCVLGYGNDEYYVETYWRQRPLGDSGTVRQTSPIEIDTFKGSIHGSYERTGSPATSCSFVGEQGEVAISGTPLTALAPGDLALFAQSVDADFHYLFVVTK